MLCSVDHYKNGEWQLYGTVKRSSPLGRVCPFYGNVDKHTEVEQHRGENLPIMMDKMSRIAGSGAPNNSDKLCKEAAIFLVGGSESWRQLGTTAASRQSTCATVRGAF